MNKYRDSILNLIGGSLLAVFLLGCPPADQASIIMVPPTPNSVGVSVEWEELKMPKIEALTYSPVIHRIKTPTGWLVVHTNVYGGESKTILIDDPNHGWLKPEVEVKEEAQFKLYIAADRATMEAVKPLVLEIERQNPNDNRVYHRLLKMWSVRIEAAEAHLADK